MFTAGSKWSVFIIRPGNFFLTAALWETEGDSGRQWDYKYRFSALVVLLWLGGGDCDLSVRVFTS